METILVIDDEEDLCRTLNKVLTKEGYRVLWTISASSGIDLVRSESPFCVLLDLKLGDTDGLTVLKEIREHDPHLPVIMLTAYDTVKTAVCAMKQGAFYYMAKPFDNEELKALIAKAVEHRQLHLQLHDLKTHAGEAEELEGTMGSSPKIREVIQLAQSVAQSDVNVLLLGESGTGKELVAQMIHNLSDRAGGPFVRVDCAAIPETLIESELFGHEKGAYTGAASMQRGKFEIANGGTLLLDEIGNIPTNVQSKLLNVLERHEFERIGGSKTIKTSVRVIAATNSDLVKNSEKDLFRLDLLYRLNEFPINLPPLRERREDIPLLCTRFIRQLQPEVKKEIKEISTEALERLMEYHFPGNVRELRNIIKRAMVLSSNGCILFTDLPPEMRSREKRTFTQEIRVPISYGLPLMEVSREATIQIERQLILDALARTNGHQGKTAKLLGIGQKTLYNKMKELGIQKRVVD